MKKIVFILFFLILSLNFMSCKNKSKEAILITSKGHFLILDENLNLIKKIQKNLDVKALISEVYGDLILFNLQSSDSFKNNIFLLNLKSEEINNLSKDLEGTFLYKPKFYNEGNYLFTLRDKNAQESLYLYSLKDNSVKIISKNIKSFYIYPFYIDNEDDKIYIHLLKKGEKNSKISLYDLNKDEFIENYISFENHFFITEPNENGEFILINYDNLEETKIFIVNLANKLFNEIYSIKDGNIYNISFFDNSDKILFKFVPFEIGKTSSIIIIDRNGNLVKEILSPFNGDFYILNSFGNKIFIMAQKDGDKKFCLYSLNIDNQDLIELTKENSFGGDLIISKEKEELIISEYKNNALNKDYFIMNLDWSKEVNLNEKLKIDSIDSIIFLK